MAEASPKNDLANSDDGSNPKIEIHPAFTEGGVILQPAEGLCFRYQLSSLTEHSTFFNDLSDLPLPEGEDNNIIPFPDTSEAVLRFTLEFIEYQRSAKVKLPALERCEILNDILEFWDKFDLSSLLLPLYAWSAEAYKDKPEVAYALSWRCLLEDCPPADERDCELRDQLASRISAFEPWALEVLQQYRPTDYAQVCRSRELCSSGEQIFRVKFLNGAIYPATFRFGNRCWGTRCTQYVEHKDDYRAFLESVLPDLDMKELLIPTRTEKRTVSFGCRRRFVPRTRLSLRFKQITENDLLLEDVGCYVCRNRIVVRARHVLANLPKDVYQSRRN